MLERMALFVLGGCGYQWVELAWRGTTHWTMFLAGGICLCLIDHICNRRMRRRPLLARCCAGSGIITCVELAAGIVVNLILHLDVWDYSVLPMNLFGQVCLPFSALWVLLSLPAMGLGRLLDRSRFLCGSPASVPDA